MPKRPTTRDGVMALAEWVQKRLDGLIQVECWLVEGRAMMPPGVNITVHESGAEFVITPDGLREAKTGDWLVRPNGSDDVYLVQASDAETRLQ